MIKKSLESIIRPMSRAVFLDHYIKNTPVVANGLLDDLSEFAELPFLKSLDSLFESWPSQVTAYLPGIADEGNSQKVMAIEAKELFHQGHGLCFDDANNFSPLLQQWSEAIRKDLGLSELTYSRNNIYAIKEGKGTAPHFDQNINFVIQISGTKKWWVAPNTHVENPLTRHTIGLDIDPELASYTRNGMPEAMPSDSTEFVLGPGSMLFVPRGAWHMTEALSDAVSLNFTFTAPSWIDVFTTALRGRLAQSSEWRETANFVNDAELHSHAAEKFDLLLSELAHEMPYWRARDILEVTEFPRNEENN
jgi:50S ribosomal protein L16 3-hydroxylase